MCSSSRRNFIRERTLPCQQGRRRTTRASPGRWHAAHPLVARHGHRGGARDDCPFHVPPSCSACWSTELGARRRLVREGNLLRLPATGSWCRRRSGLVERIMALLGPTPLSPPDVKQIARDAGRRSVKADRADARHGKEPARSLASRPSSISLRTSSIGCATSSFSTCPADRPSPPPSSAIATRHPASTRFRCSNISIAKVSRSGSATQTVERQRQETHEDPRHRPRRRQAARTQGADKALGLTQQVAAAG